MHGPEECMGNIVELCAANIYPDPKIYLGFTMCLTRDYKDIPQHDLMADCALEHGMDLAKLDECAVRDDGGFGVGMLRDSVRRSTDVRPSPLFSILLRNMLISILQAGVTKSCTVRVNEEIYCIRDGGKWKDCPNGPGVNDLVIAIEKLYRS
jgi:Gamma interferon inducible lysosomal thiol reductase (GILT)